MKKERTTVSFYARKMVDPSRGKIYCRLTIDGSSKDFSTGCIVALSKWDVKRYRVTGCSEAAISVNDHLKAIEVRLQNIMTDLIKVGRIITIKSVYDKFTLADERKHTVISSFIDHNKDFAKLVEKGANADSTLERYETAMNHVQQFMREEYRVDDMPLVELDMQFISRYYLFLRTVRNCNNNSAQKYVENFRKIVRRAVEFNWLEKDPFIAHKKKLDKVERDCLTQKELKALKEKEFDVERLDRIRDVFLFACFTGYAYTDMAKLTHNSIEEDDNGNKWIIARRTKTDVAEDVPLVYEAERIIEKYRNDPECVAKGILVPVLSNQKYNAYLKEIADLCGIKKKLTSHIARYTFGTVMKELRVPEPVIQKMMGHLRLIQTQHYSHTRRSFIGCLQGNCILLDTLTLRKWGKKTVE